MQKDQKKLIQIYMIYIISLICNVVPSGTVQTLGMIFFIIIFIATYIYKSKSKENSLIHSHMVFIIKSIWISSLLLIIGMAVSYIFADHTIIHQTVDSVKNGIMFDENQLNEIMMNYLIANSIVFIATLSPSLIYLFYRLGKGIIAVKENSMITNPKNWL